MLVPKSLGPTVRATRWKQTVLALTCREDPRVDQQIQSLLDQERQWALVARLAPFDRRHVLEVHNRLVSAGHSDPDLLRAALLHDIGKADDVTRVATIHRIVRVALGRMYPPVLPRLAAPNSISRGLFLAEHHAALGATAAREAGASDRCCWLIREHERAIDSVTDPDLISLIAADEGLPIR